MRRTIEQVQQKKREQAYRLSRLISAKCRIVRNPYNIDAAVIKDALTCLGSQINCIRDLQIMSEVFALLSVRDIVTLDVLSNVTNAA